MAAIALDYNQIGGQFQDWLQSLGPPVHFAWDFKLSDTVFLLYGVATFAIVSVAAWQLLLPAASAPNKTGVETRLTVFLLLWLGLEMFGFFMMTPFPAVRRVFGVMVVATLLTGRLLARTHPTGATRRTVWTMAGAIGLGLAYAALDFIEARAEQVAANQAADWVQAEVPSTLNTRDIGDGSTTQNIEA